MSPTTLLLTPVLNRSAEVLGGTLVFAGTRVPFQTFVDYLKAGERLADFLEDFPTVTRDQVIAVLENAQQSLMREANASPAG
ncbi:MAG: DUF433 domain-containing protein [Chloroflexi bacterium]|nr:DUF433 domain-containing protein [Chloroflexota bacterium]MBI5080393.1 DUF433 domain-containing protein [Chloroflexota bacterium]